MVRWEALIALHVAAVPSSQVPRRVPLPGQGKTVGSESQ